MSPPPPRTMFDEYLLVDRKTYDRWTARDRRERNDAAATAPPAPDAASVNPFQNPHVREAKRLRREIESLTRANDVGESADGAVTAAAPGELNRAVETARLLLQDYRREFDRASGRKTAPSSNPKRGQRVDNADAVSSPHTPTVGKRSRARSRSPLTTLSGAKSRSRVPSRPVPVERRASAAIDFDDAVVDSPAGAASPSVKAKRRVGRFRTTGDVTRSVGGYVSESDAKKMMPLLNALDEAGYVRADGNLVDRVEDGGVGEGDDGFLAKRADLRDYIREVTINDLARRSNNARDIEAFGRFLKRAGVEFSIKPSTARVSERSSKKKDPRRLP